MLSGARTERPSLHHYDLDAWRQPQGLPEISPISSDSAYELMSRRPSVWDVTGSGAQRPFLYSDGIPGNDTRVKAAVDGARRDLENTSRREVRTVYEASVEETHGRVVSAAARGDVSSVLPAEVEKLGAMLLPARATLRAHVTAATMSPDPALAKDIGIAQRDVGYLRAALAWLVAFAQAYLPADKAAEIKRLVDAAISGGATELRPEIERQGGGSVQSPIGGNHYYDPFRALRSMSEASSDGTLEAIRGMHSVWDAIGSVGQRPFLYSDGSSADGRDEASWEEFQRMRQLYQHMMEKFGISLGALSADELVLNFALIRNELNIGREYGLFNRVLEGFINETDETPADFVAAFKDYARQFLLRKVAGASGSGGQGSGPASAHFFEDPNSAYMTLADDYSGLTAVRAGIDTVGFLGGASSPTSAPFYRSSPAPDGLINRARAFLSANIVRFPRNVFPASIQAEATIRIDAWLASFHRADYQIQTFGGTGNTEDAFQIVTAISEIERRLPTAGLTEVYEMLQYLEHHKFEGRRVDLDYEVGPTASRADVTGALRVLNIAIATRVLEIMRDGELIRSVGDTLPPPIRMVLYEGQSRVATGTTDRLLYLFQALTGSREGIYYVLKNASRGKPVSTVDLLIMTLQTYLDELIDESEHVWSGAASAQQFSAGVDAEIQRLQTVLAREVERKSAIPMEEPPQSAEELIRPRLRMLPIYLGRVSREQRRIDSVRAELEGIAAATEGYADALGQARVAEIKGLVSRVIGETIPASSSSRVDKGGGGNPNGAVPGPSIGRFFEHPASAHMTMMDDPTSIDAFRAGMERSNFFFGGAFRSISRPFYRSGPSTVAGIVEDTGETSGGAFEGSAGQLASSGGAGASHQRVARQQVAGARIMVQTRLHASLPVVTPAMAPIRSTIGRL